MLSRFGHVLSHTSRGEPYTLSYQGYLQLLKSLKWLKLLAVAVTAAKGLVFTAKVTLDASAQSMALRAP